VEDTPSGQAESSASIDNVGCVDEDEFFDALRERQNSQKSLYVVWKVAGLRIC
jgi:hypothetical protein